MEGDVTSGVLVIGGEGRDEGEQDEGKGEEGESLQQPKTIQRRERGGGGGHGGWAVDAVRLRAEAIVAKINDGVRKDP